MKNTGSFTGSNSFIYASFDLEIMKELTAFDIFNLIKEAQFLAGGKIDNIYQLGPMDLYLQAYVKGRPKQLLRIFAGKFFYLAKTKPEFPPNQQRFCSYLKKYLINAGINSIEQVDYERIIKITLGTKEAEYELFAELFGKGNIILAKGNKIISVAEEQIWAERKLMPGETYSYPKKADSMEIFEKYRKKGPAMTMEMLNEMLSKQIPDKISSAKEKEKSRIKTIIEKQEENLIKALEEAEINKRKGELIYEHYQEAQEAVKKAKGAKKTLIVELN